MNCDDVSSAASAVLFAGQGSQFRGMGAGLFDRYAEDTAVASDVLGYDLSRLCLEDPDGLLNDTRYTQPALYVVNALTYRATVEDGEPDGDFLLGHSLGEYNALLAAGAFDFETGLKLVAKRGALMAGAGSGAMLAVIGPSVDELRDMLASKSLSQLDVANVNTPTQTVLSGPTEDIRQAKRLLEGERVRVTPLRVSAAFHSRYMRPAGAEFSAFLKGFRFAPLRRAVIANVTAQPYVDGRVALTLSEQISGPVRWVDSVRYLLRHVPGERCREVGGSGALTRMLRQIAADPPRPSPPERSGARPRLFCIAYAGGDAQAYTGLAEHCTEVDLTTLERPGRGRRCGEPLCNEAGPIVDDLFAQIRDRLDAPYALYGHSLGARLAFLLSRRLRSEGLPPPRRLFVSGERGPSLPSRERDTWRLPTGAFWEHLSRLGGIPRELLEYEDLMVFYERILRADFTALGGYRHETEPPLDVPVTVFTGDGEGLTEADVQAWQRETAYPLASHWFTGGHFFIREHWPALGKIISTALHDGCRGRPG